MAVSFVIHNTSQSVQVNAFELDRVLPVLAACIQHSFRAKIFQIKVLFSFLLAR